MIPVDCQIKEQLDAVGITAYCKAECTVCPDCRSPKYMVRHCCHGCLSCMEGAVYDHPDVAFDIADIDGDHWSL